MKQNNLKPINNQIVFYTTPNGNVKLEVFIQDETLWVTQKMMSELFGVDIRTINEHLQNIFNSEELIENSTIRKFRIVQKEGARDIKREVAFYNLDATIAVGYHTMVYILHKIKMSVPYRLSMFRLLPTIRRGTPKTIHSSLTTQF